MSIRLNGTTGYLSFNAGIATGLPFYIAFYVAERSDTGNHQIWFCHSQTTSDRAAYVMRINNGNMAASYAWTGNGDAATLVAPTINTTLRTGIAAFQSAGRQLWYGSTTEGTSTTSVTDQVSNHNQFLIGAFQYNSGAVANFSNIDVCEVHIYTGTPTDTDYNNFAAATSSGNFPENLPNWVDGWVLSNSSDLTSIGGTRTLTANGGVSDGVANPFTRTISVTSDQGIYTLTGQATTLTATRTLTAEQGSYSLAGQDVTFAYVQPGVTIINAEHGTYTITGSGALAQMAMNAEYGIYTITGRPTFLLGPGDTIPMSTSQALSIAISMGVS